MKNYLYTRFSSKQTERKSTNWSGIGLPRLNWSVILVGVCVCVYWVFLSQPRER